MTPNLQRQWMLPPMNFPQNVVGGGGLAGIDAFGGQFDHINTANVAGGGGLVGMGAFGGQLNHVNNVFADHVAENRYSGIGGGFGGYGGYGRGAGGIW